MRFTNTTCIRFTNIHFISTPVSQKFSPVGSSSDFFHGLPDVQFSRWLRRLCIGLCMGSAVGIESVSPSSLHLQDCKVCLLQTISILVVRNNSFVKRRILKKLVNASISWTQLNFSEVPDSSARTVVCSTWIVIEVELGQEKNVSAKNSKSAQIWNENYEMV